MRKITLPRLRMAELQSLTERIIGICKPLDLVKIAVKKVEQAFVPFKESMLRETSTGADRKATDTSRDVIWNGFFDAFEAELAFPLHSQDQKAELKNLKGIVDKYGKYVARLPFDEQTVTADNMLEEVKKISLDALSETGLSRWIPVIQQSNNEFKGVSKEKITTSAKIAQTQSASSLAPPLLDAIDNLLGMLWITLRMEPTDEIVTTYTELQKLVDSYR